MHAIVAPRAPDGDATFDLERARRRGKNSRVRRSAAPPADGYGTPASGTRCLTALASPLTSPSRTVTGTGGVSLKR